MQLISFQKSDEKIPKIDRIVSIFSRLYGSRATIAFEGKGFVCASLHSLEITTILSNDFAKYGISFSIKLSPFPKGYFAVKKKRTFPINKIEFESVKLIKKIE